MKSRKLFAALLCALLCLLAAGIALADEESPVIASGSCGAGGSNVTWKLTEDGTLTITGSGAMKNYSDSSSVPWYSYNTVVKNAVIESGVTGIGSYAFAGCSSLASIILPDGVTSIGSFAFFNCSSLTSVTIPDSVTSIGYYAFAGCSSLASIILPDGVTSIGNCTFYYCRSLTSITIPESVTSIGSSAFYYCSSLTSITIPESVTSIGSDAFQYCSSLTSIILPDGVTIIGGHVFFYCSSLKDVYYQGNIVEWLNIDFQSSYSNPCCNGANIYINGKKVTDIVIPESVTSIGDYAFHGCSSLTSITISDSVTSIGSYAFCNCSSLTSIAIPDGVTSIGSYAFCDCSSLTSIAIPDGVTSIGSYAFDGCSSLTSIILPDSVTNIGSGAFPNCSSLTSIILPESVTSIGSDAFSNCSSLTSIILPDSVTGIGDWAFSGCSSLTGINIPDGVTSIGQGAFYNCSSLRNIFIPSSVQTISASYSSDSPFYGCSSLTIWTDAREKQSGWGTYWNYYQTIMYGTTRTDCEYWSTCDKTAENFIIPDGVTSIPEEAFYYCSSLTDITIPDSVTSIGNYAFESCNSLTSITIPDSVTSIGDWAFAWCSSLTSITIPDSVTSIGDNVFYDCNSLTSITIPYSVTSIGSGAFDGCSSLTSITIPDSVTSIGDSAFWGCRSLTSITIPDSVTSISDYAFYGCSSLTSITIPDSVTSISGGAFKGCSSLTGITIPDGVTSIGESAFEGCSSLTSITIPDSVTSIGYYAFYSCYSLNLYLPDNISSVGSDAFYSVHRIYCNPRTGTSGSVANAGYRYCIPGNDDFYLTESDGLVKVYSYGGSRNSVIIPDGINEWIYSDTVSAVRLPATLCDTDVFTLKANTVTVPEGVTSMGALSLSDVRKMFVPASVTDMSGVNVTDSSAPTVYCEMDSEAELWAIVNGYDTVYTDAEGWDDECSFSYIVSTYPSLDVGETFTLSLKDFIIEPMPVGEIVITLVGDEYVSASGMTFTAVKPGYANPQAVFGTHKVTVPMHVYQTPTYMKLEAPLFAQAGAAFNVTLAEAAPADISGKFTWQQDGSTPMTDTVLTHTFTAPSQPGSTVITVTVPGGYSQSVTVTVAGSISAPYAGGNSRAAVTGSFIDICVDVDGVTYRNTAELYGEVTVPATAADIIELTEDGRIHVIGSGRTAFSVTGLDGKKVNFIVIASEAGGVLTLPAGTVSIGEEAFAGTAAQKVVLPSGCVSIGSRAFAGSAVQIVNVPASVTSIADDAFSGCSVTVYCPAGSYAESWCAAHSVNCVAE